MLAIVRKLGIKITLEFKRLFKFKLNFLFK